VTTVAGSGKKRALKRPLTALGASRVRVVGIGASAGGLEAMGAFLKGIPPASGLAFVIVQHLDPTHKGMLPELLQRDTLMRVVQVKDRTKVWPDTVYVIPPNKDMSLLHGRLHLFTPAAARGLRLPIDFFFRSLALDAKEDAVGVILSGMGTDGTIGLRAIKEVSGLTLVQDPAAAKFGGMPNSAIQAGLADLVAPAEDLAGKLLAFLTHATRPARSEPFQTAGAASALDKIVLLLRAQTGHDFSSYKKSVLYRRIERRMSIHQIDSAARYVRFLQENIQERELLFKELLIGVTRFFRDPGAWRRLEELALPGLLAGKPAENTLRAWITGCSTGEEAYSLAIAVREAGRRGRAPGAVRIQIFATDLDREAVDRARAGIYPAGIAADLTPERLRRYFVKEGQGFRVGKEVRESIVFAAQNMVMDPPFTKLDILICRNLLIYLEPELQKKLLPLFHYSLNPGGILFLGTSESIAGFSDLFETLDAKQKIFRRRETARSAVAFPSSFSPSIPDLRRRVGAKPASVSLQVAAEQLLFGRFVPPAVLVNNRGDVLFFSGRTGAYLEPAAGKADLNIFAMAREGLRFELADAFRAAVRSGGEIVRKSLKIRSEAGERLVDLIVRPLEEPGPLREMVLIIFAESKLRGRGDVRSTVSFQPRRAAALELSRSREQFLALRQEMQTSQEEIKSANEELQSMNEELQSTNEELTTSKEELQSMNEELQTVNAELQARVEELSRAQNDMKNLLNATDIATIFLDGHLRIRRFTERAGQLFKLIPSDQGRPVTDLATDLVYPDMITDAGKVIRILVPVEKSIQARDGRWFTVRVMPYRTTADVIDGVVMTFADITTAKNLEAELRRRRGPKTGLKE
jgi:two-component system, chemotaxis family, CheB/CheR fusion protein